MIFSGSKSHAISTSALSPGPSTTVVRAARQSPSSSKRSPRKAATSTGMRPEPSFVTVAVTWFDLGSFNLVAALAIAVVKASLVLLYFMHLRWDRPFNAVVLLLSLVLVVLFIALALLDSKEYEVEVIPGYAPDMQN